MKKKTREKQYNVQLDNVAKHGAGQMGLTASFFWQHDSKHLLFTLARYKFVAKLLADKEMVAELGCGDAFGMRLIAGNVKKVDGYDFDPVFVENAINMNQEVKNAHFFVHDILTKTLPKKYNAIYALDVLEHIDRAKEKTFMRHVVKSLAPQGIFIAGSPNLTSQKYASKPSKIGHVNCKTHDELKTLFNKYFHTVFVFSMNDEVVHTGFGPMAHYLFAVGVGQR